MSGRRDTMLVVKRTGLTENVQFDKISIRIRNLSGGLDHRYIDPVKVAQKCVAGVFDGIHTYEIDRLAAEISASMSTDHPDYSQLAARILVSDLHKRTPSSFLECVRILRGAARFGGSHRPLVSAEIERIANEKREQIESAIDHYKDHNYTYFGIRTLERSYLLKIGDKIIERPQHMLMRVSLGICGNDIRSAIETYKAISKGYYTHATPTLFNAGTENPQLASCFLVAMEEDSIHGIYSTLSTCASISKLAGGVGLSVSNIRPSGSLIRGTNGRSTGLVPMLKVFESTFMYVNQGGRRAGSCAVYLECWHGDVIDFLDLRLTRGDEVRRCRNLFTALWISDLFMRRVESDDKWSLFCPDLCPGLQDSFGKDFDDLYEKYETEGRALRVVQARKIWDAIVTSQIETGTPYILNKDACNSKSNQKNLGTIRSSNLCCEIIQYSSAEETATCNLASAILPKFVTAGSASRGPATRATEAKFDHDALFSTVRLMTRNLNRVIDRTLYPVESAKRSNLRHRPIGIGVQGLADVFCMLRMPFDSDRAKRLNKEIFETIYFAALTESNALAKKDGAYSSFRGSPASKGVLQFDMWGVVPGDRWDWTELKATIQKDGLRNSLVTAPMPTATTAQINGTNECFEPFTSNLYVRRVMSGEFIQLNQFMVRDLIRLDLWNKDMLDHVTELRGSIQSIEEIPEEIRCLYKTVWEIKQKDLIDMAADRGVFVDQSQSFNLFLAEPTVAKVSSMLFYAWKKGLKTCMYYLRTLPATNAIQFTVRRNGKRPIPRVVSDCSTSSTPDCAMCSA
jgi:ribonucleoside-diphosphate reductase alpha subunit